MKIILDVYFHLKYNLAFLVFAISAICHRPFYLRNSKRILLEVFSLSNKAGISIWLDGGTLLGQIRDKKFVLFDTDVDFAVHNNDVDAMLAILKDNNFEFVGSFNFIGGRIAILKFKKYNLDVDISIFHQTHDGMVRYSPRVVKNSKSSFYAHPYKFVGFSSVNTLSVESGNLNFYYPENFDEYLQVYYGNWRRKVNVYKYFMDIYYASKRNNNFRLTKSNSLIFCYNK